MIRYFILFILCSSVLAEEKEVTPKDTLTRLAKKLLGEKGGDRLFYYPTKTAPNDPTKFGYKFETVHFPTTDEVKLHGWFLKPAKGTETKGTVVFHHGNSGSIGYHLPFVTWMVNAGYQVLLYDYRGYGKSEGTISRKGLVEDVRSAINYVKTRKDVDDERIISFGHSLGGAKSLAALGEKMIPGVRGVISFAGFASYQDMARKFAGQMGANLVSDDYSASDFVGKISPVPLLLAHGTVDSTVPLSQGEKLLKAAKEPKTFFKIPNGSHSRALYMNNGEYRKKVLAWMAKVLS